MKYRRKVEVVEAIQWTEGVDLKEITDFVGESWDVARKSQTNGFLDFNYYLKIYKFDEYILVDLNDYIIKNSNNEIYCYTQDEFLRLYERMW